MASDSPFGKATRLKALVGYLKGAGEITAENAWTHVYRLLLSVDRRTQLAHVYDSNHMQKGGNWHKRAARFTDLLCERWGITRKELPGLIDVMFKHCVKKFEEQREEDADDPGATDADDVVSEFSTVVSDLLVARLGASHGADLDGIVGSIEQAAERFYEIERKRQNVRGEGFEDTLEWLLTRVSGIPDEQIRVRCRAPELPGFKPDLPEKGTKSGGRKSKVPKPDIALLSPDEQLTLWIVTAKWSLRQDRLDQFGQEAEFYKANKVQQTEIESVFITNEMDVARLKDVLDPPHGAGGFHFHRVYHLNLDLLEATHQESFKQLAVYKESHRLLGLDDLLRDAPVRLPLMKRTSPRAAR